MLFVDWLLLSGERSTILRLLLWSTCISILNSRSGSSFLTANAGEARVFYI